MSALRDLAYFIQDGDEITIQSYKGSITFGQVMTQNIKREVDSLVKLQEQFRQVIKENWE